MSYSDLRQSTYLLLILVSMFSSFTVHSETISSDQLPVEGILDDDSDEDFYDEDDDDDEDELYQSAPVIQVDPDDSLLFLDSTQKYLSSSVESLAKTMDEYFVSDKIFYDSSGSYLSLIYNMAYSEGGIIKPSNTIRFKLRLPNTEKNFKIFFETTPETDANTISQQLENPPVKAVEEDNFLLGIQAESGEGFGWKYKPTLGINIDAGMDPFAKFKFSREEKFTKWSLYWHETPYWVNSLGWGLDSYFELNRKISESTLFRSSTFSGWKNKTNQSDLSHVFTIFHTVNKRKAMSYYAGGYGVSYPSISTTQFLIGAKYRENLNKDYLFIEIEPQIRYIKENRFHAEHSIIFRLEMLFKK